MQYPQQQYSFPDPVDLDPGMPLTLGKDEFNVPFDDSQLNDIFNVLSYPNAIEDLSRIVQNGQLIRNPPLDPSEALYDNGSSLGLLKQLGTTDTSFFQTMSAWEPNKEVLNQENMFSPSSFTPQITNSSLLAAASTIASSSQDDQSSPLSTLPLALFSHNAAGSISSNDVPNSSDEQGTPPWATTEFSADKLDFFEQMAQSVVGPSADFQGLPLQYFMPENIDISTVVPEIQQANEQVVSNGVSILPASDKFSLTPESELARSKSVESDVAPATPAVTCLPTPIQPAPPAKLQNVEMPRNYFPSPISSEHSGDDNSNKRPIATVKTETAKRKRSSLTAAEKELKARDRVLRNRAAAQDSRDKKRRYVDTLESTNTKLCSENQHLTEKLLTMEQSNKHLSQQVNTLADQLNTFKKMLSDASFTKVAAAASTIASLTSSLLLPGSDSSKSISSMTLGALSDPERVKNSRRSAKSDPSMPRMAPSKPTHRKRSHSLKKSIAPGLPTTVSSIPSSPAMLFEESWHAISASEDQSGEEELTCSSSSLMSLPQRPSESVSTLTNKVFAKFVSLLVTCSRLLTGEPAQVQDLSKTTMLAEKLTFPRGQPRFKSPTDFFSYMARCHTSCLPTTSALGARSMTFTTHKGALLAY